MAGWAQQSFPAAELQGVAGLEEREAIECWQCAQVNVWF